MHCAFMNSVAPLLRRAVCGDDHNDDLLDTFADSFTYRPVVRLPSISVLSRS